MRPRMSAAAGRIRALAAGAAVTAVTVTVVSGCGSSSKSETPAGIDARDAQSLNASQFSSADAAARATLAPAPGSFLQGKTTRTTMASTTPENGDVTRSAIWRLAADMGSLHAGDVLVDNFNNK